MTQNSYLKLVRQYAILTGRTGKSYADVVHALTVARHNAIVESGLDREAERKALDALKSAVEREYGKFDASFSTAQYPF